MNNESEYEFEKKTKAEEEIISKCITENHSMGVRGSNLLGADEWKN